MEYQRIKAFLIILIADDENLVRLGLKKVIKDSQLDSVEILEARNGREMVGVCQNTAPDLAFVDIKMPLLDGLEAIRAAKEFCPHTLWVMLTGFSEFRFSQNAISLGVKDYLIKPFEPEKIQKILLDAQQHVQKKHMDSNHFFELQVSHLFNTPQTARDSDYFCLAPGQLFTAFHFYESFASKRDHSHSLYSILLPQLRQWLSAWRSTEDYYALFSLQSGLICLVARASSAQTKRILRYLEGPAMASHLTSTAIFCCQSQKDIRDLYAQSNALSELLPMALCLQKGRPYFPEELKALLRKEHTFSFCKYLTCLIQAYMEKDEIRYQKYLEKMRNLPNGQALLDTFSPYLSESLAQAMDFPALPAAYGDFCQKLHSHSQNMFAKSNATPPDIIGQVKAYIDINYANDVSIISLAEAFHLAPTYLSKIFHERAGMKLIDYVMEVRIKNAKRLMMENPSILIKNVALLVGYYSTRHFKDVFQKQTGILPSEFQKQLKKSPQDGNEENKGENADYS